MTGGAYRVLRNCILVLLAVMCSHWAVWGLSAPTEDEKVTIVTTILPYVEFVREIGGDHVVVDAMVPPGASPHTWEPLPSQLVVLTDAVLYVKVGSGIEFELTWLSRLAGINGNMTIVDTSRGIVLRYMQTPGNMEGSALEHDSHQYSPERYDPHVWLSLRNARTISENICEALIAVDPDNMDEYVAGKQRYVEKLEELDKSIGEKMRRVKDRKFVVLHPAWGYFARDYGLEQIPIEVEGKEPSPRAVARIIDEARTLGSKVVFVSPQFSAQSAEGIAREIGGRTIAVDPLAENYLSNIEQAALQLAAALDSRDATRGKEDE